MKAIIIIDACTLPMEEISSGFIVSATAVLLLK